MNRVVIILVSLCMVLCSGCIEVGYKTEVKLSFFKKNHTRPTIVESNGYPKRSKPTTTRVSTDIKTLELEGELRRRGLEIEKLKQEQQIQKILKYRRTTSFAKFNN